MGRSFHFRSAKRAPPAADRSVRQRTQECTVWNCDNRLVLRAYLAVDSPAPPGGFECRPGRVAAGKGNYKLYSLGMHMRIVGRLEFESDLAHALD
jgi:hypothetical protein